MATGALLFGLACCGAACWVADPVLGVGPGGFGGGLASGGSRVMAGSRDSNPSRRDADRRDARNDHACVQRTQPRERGISLGA